MRKPLVVAITGASGVRYGLRLVAALLESKQRVFLVVSDAARLVFQEEDGLALKGISRREHFEPVFGAEACQNLEVYSNRDFTAPMASGSFPVAGMVIVPCSMKTLAAVASGYTQNLIQRAADCMLKESRRLIIVPRETPLNAIHLENMLKLSRLGVRIVPAMPGFYGAQRSIDDMVDFMAGKILDQLDISHALYPRWTGRLSQEATPAGERE